MLQKHYDEFYEEVFYEIESKYGEIEEMNVCENLGDHIVGNVYIKFYKEEDAEKAQEALNERWFGADSINAELRYGFLVCTNYSHIEVSSIKRV